MAALSVQVPYPVFYDRDGLPLDSGRIYIGDANLDPIANPLQVYYDEALTIPAAQPLITSGGYIYRNGTPTQLYVNAVNFSITVKDSKNILVYSFPDGTGLGVGAASIEYDPPFAGAVTSNYTVADKLAQYVSVKDFGAVGDGVTDDTAALSTAFDYAAANGVALEFAGGQTYLCDLNSIVVTLADNETLTVYGNNALLKQRTANTSIGGNPALITVQAATTLSTTTKVNIYDLNFDGSVQPVDWTAPLGTGSNAVKILDVYAIQMDGCKAEKFWFSSVFQFLRTHYVNVTNCYMKEVGGHTPLDNSASANGDAVQFYDIPNGAAYHVSNCTFIGYPTTPYQGGYPHNLSRAGIVFELGNGVNPAFKGTVDNCYFDGFSIVVHVELTAYADISVTNVLGISGWALVGGFGQFFKVRVDNCSWSPIVSGTYNGINGFVMCDIGASDFTLDICNSYYRPVSATRMDGTYYDCTFDDFSKDNFQCGGSTSAFYNCTFNGVEGSGGGADYLFFGDTFSLFEGCKFNAASAGNEKVAFVSRATSPLRFIGCEFNDCGVYVDGSAGSSFSLDACQISYSAPVSSLVMLDYAGTVKAAVRNSQFYAASTSVNAKLNSSATGTLTEFSNSYVRNATVYTIFAQPFTMIGSTIEFEAAATPTAQGFFGRFSDYVIVSGCTFIQPTATPITLATPDLRNSSVLRTAGTVAPLANI